MTAFNWQSELARDGSRVFVAGLPVAMHCHHYNINLQKTLEDTLGDEGIQLPVAWTRSCLFDRRLRRRGESYWVHIFFQ